MPEWIGIEETGNILPRSPGVYIIRWCRNGEPVRIGRLRGEDRKGILYIGSAKDLRERVRQLLKSLSGESGEIRHTMAGSYLFFSLSEVIGINEMEITWIELNNSNEAQRQEWLALRYYGKKFGELPPLNLQALRSKYAVVGLAEVGRSRVVEKLDQRLRDIIN